MRAALLAADFLFRVMTSGWMFFWLLGIWAAHAAPVFWHRPFPQALGFAQFSASAALRGWIEFWSAKR